MKKLLPILLVLTLVLALTACASESTPHTSEETTVADDLTTEAIPEVTTANITTATAAPVDRVIAPHPYPSPFNWVETFDQMHNGTGRWLGLFYAERDFSQPRSHIWSLPYISDQSTWQNAGRGSAEPREDFAHVLGPISNRDEAAQMALAIEDALAYLAPSVGYQQLAAVLHDPQENIWIFSYSPTSADGRLVMGYGFNVVINGGTGELLRTWWS